MNCGQIIDFFVACLIFGIGVVGMFFGWDHQDSCSNNLPLGLVLAGAVFVGYSSYFFYRIFYDKESVFKMRGPDMLWSLLLATVDGYLIWEYNGTSSSQCNKDTVTYSLFAIVVVGIISVSLFVYLVIQRYACHSRG